MDGTVGDNIRGGRQARVYSAICENFGFNSENLRGLSIAVGSESMCPSAYGECVIGWRGDDFKG